jgi:hypothetical protein
MMMVWIARHSFAICLSGVATCVIANEHAPSSAHVKECAARTQAADVIRRRIDASRQILSIEEADCAFAEFNTGGLSRHCARIKSIADPLKQRTWGEIHHAWNALNRSKLSLRQFEDRVGIECDTR